ncbi:hypothetical protein BD310DRAFT_935219 [Dichomitus squalens]|uniref:F-box domain-containing protein n=1 Tax=Dichomitus squalens TaxID=114155 RepID=A0A4V2K751_9APHY|nr:hypothetical protein BD310DRAFT_935219 [Dichomitus squalens]
MLRILRRCPSDRTDALEIEYVADDDNDEELLQFIPQAFPNLRRLNILRHRRRETDAVPVVRPRSFCPRFYTRL